MTISFDGLNKPKTLDIISSSPHYVFSKLHKFGIVMCIESTTYITRQQVSEWIHLKIALVKWTHGLSSVVMVGVIQDIYYTQRADMLNGLPFIMCVESG